MAKTKIDILTPVPRGRDFSTTEVFIPSTLILIWNGQVLNSPKDFAETQDISGNYNGFRLSFYLPGNAGHTFDSLSAIYQTLDQSGLTLQETLRKVNTEMRFQFIAKPGLTTDPRITIYNNTGNVKLVDNIVMTEKDNKGVYEYNFTPTTLGTYTAVMKESSDNHIQVTEIMVADGDIQAIYEKILEIRQTQVLGTPKIIMGDC
jgi:hypothetical protein